ncbi:MAG: aminomethyl-transferring glycine dehydrogenase subunit GcvPB [Calditrichaeota bacterium]|nr:aminomethyl-transferring glycine dehydrogenase subunit GcvPB [Calditrichota bacterium]
MNDEPLLIFDRSVTGRIGIKLPETDVPSTEPTDVLPAHLIRKIPAQLPEVSEPEVVRHFISLSTRNHHVDKNLYPLGSCTMKYNPKVNDALADLPGFSGLHPGQSEASCQGTLALMYGLEQALVKITGMSRFTLQPAAGSQGEMVGVLIMRKYHETKGSHRKYVIIPDSAHGTNPASVVMAGYETLKVATDPRGRVDLADLRGKLSDEVAGMMLTQPNTLGLFEDEIVSITQLIHSVDGIMYMDGANLNALMGLTRPADMGFDITHINLHKTFSTPHGGGGPGSGPIGVAERLVQFLPRPLVEGCPDGSYKWDDNGPHSVGRVLSFFGNFAMIVRAYAYILSLGEEGLQSVSRWAVLNANYLKVRLVDIFELPYGEGVMHEFVLSGSRQKERGVKTLDLAKALLDYGFHAPTIYFPLVVPEALMIEPTESETKATLDRFAEVLHQLDRLVDEDPESLLEAPRHTPVGRLDETRANRQLDVRWRAGR